MINHLHHHLEIPERINHLWKMVGSTPMLEINYTYKNEPRTIYAKSEHYNLTGSIKDRMALYILEQSYKNETIKPGNVIVEATSGNTGIAFAAIGKALGHPVKIIMPNWLSKERMDIIQSLGAEIILITKEEGGFLGSIALSEKMKRENDNIFLPQQFKNLYNAKAHYLTTGPEIWEQLQSIEKSVDAFVAGVGTGGTVMGMKDFLKDVDSKIKVHPLEPEESPTLTTGHKVGSHRIQGISDEFIPEIVKLNELDEVVQASDGDSILMAQKLAHQLGLAVGISSGANFLGAVKLQNMYGADKTVVTIFSDSNKKYLSTDLMKNEPIKSHYLTPDIELEDFDAIKRF
ncbi:MAG: cysteine synthase family protein [Bacteroidota bacterium]